MSKKYLDEKGLEEVAKYVNEKTQIFKGSEAEFEALPLTEQKKYDYLADTDSISGEVQTYNIACTIQGNINIRKIGKIVQIRYVALDNTQMILPGVTWEKIATLPSGLNPINTIYTIDQGEGGCIVFSIKSDGDIYAYKIANKNPTYEVAFNAVYIID